MTTHRGGLCSRARCCWCTASAASHLQGDTETTWPLSITAAAVRGAERAHSEWLQPHSQLTYDLKCDWCLSLSHTHIHAHPQMSVIFFGANICMLTSPCTGPLSSAYALTHSRKHPRKHAKSTPKIARAPRIRSCAHQVLVRTGQSLWDCSAVVVAHCDRWRLVGVCACFCVHI